MLRRRGLGVLLALFVLSLPAVNRRVYASDEIQYYAFLRSVWFDHDLSFENEYQRLLDQGASPDSGFRETFLTGPPTPTGLRPSFATIGCAILWSPFYAAGHLLALVLAYSGSPIATDGYSWPFTLAVAIGSACYGFGALLLGAQVAESIVGKRSTAAVAAIWFGTPLLFYMYVAPFFAHACEAFVVALVIRFWIRARTNWLRSETALLGALGGLAYMVREQEALLLVVPVLDAVVASLDRHDMRRSVSRAAQRVAILGAGFVLAAAPQFWSYLVVNGRLGPNTTVSRKMSWMSPHALDVLVSPAHGLFAWTPLAFVALLGLVCLAAWGSFGAGGSGRSRSNGRLVALYLALMFLVHTYVVGSLLSWNLAGAFGQRRFVALTPMFIVGLAAACEQIRTWSTVARRFAWAVIVVCVWWNLGLMAQFGLNTMNRQRLDLVQDARRTFLEVPAQLPALAWRFITDRSSFYRSPR